MTRREWRPWIFVWSGPFLFSVVLVLLAGTADRRAAAAYPRPTPTPVPVVDVQAWLRCKPNTRYVESRITCEAIVRNMGTKDATECGLAVVANGDQVAFDGVVALRQGVICAHGPEVGFDQRVGKAWDVSCGIGALPAGEGANVLIAIRPLVEGSTTLRLQGACMPYGRLDPPDGDWAAAEVGLEVAP